MDSYGISEALSQSNAMTTDIQTRNAEIRHKKKDLITAGALQSEQDDAATQGADQQNLLKTGFQGALATGNLEGLNTLPGIRGKVKTFTTIGSDGKSVVKDIPKGETFLQSQARLRGSRNPTAGKLYDYATGKSNINVGAGTGPDALPRGSLGGAVDETLVRANPLSSSTRAGIQSVYRSGARPPSPTGLSRAAKARRARLGGSLSRSGARPPSPSGLSRAGFPETDAGVPSGGSAPNVADDLHDASNVASGGEGALKEGLEIGAKDVGKAVFSGAMKVAGNLQGGADIYDLAAHGFHNKNATENWGEGLTAAATMFETAGLVFPVFEGIGAVLQIAGGITTAVGEHEEKVENQTSNADHNATAVAQQTNLVVPSLSAQGQIANQSQHLQNNVSSIGAF